MELKKVLFGFMSLLFCAAVYAQADQIILHNGEKIVGNVSKVAESTVIFTYEGEDTEQVLGKYAVAKIIHGGSNREQEVSPKIDISGEGGWKNVVILEDPDAVVGLKRLDEVRGKTAAFNYRSGAGADKKAQEKLQKETAELHGEFLLITSEKDLETNNNRRGGGLIGAVGGLGGNHQAVKDGVAYSY